MDSERSRNITLIAKELGVDVDGAEDFITKVWKVLGKRVTSKLVVKALRQIGNPKKITPNAVASFFDPSVAANQIAYELGTDRASAGLFCKGVSGSLGMRVEYITILKVIWQNEDLKKIKPGIVASQIKINTDGSWTECLERIKPRTVASQIEIDTISLIAVELGVDKEAAINLVAQVKGLSGKQRIDHAMLLKAIQHINKDRKDFTPPTIAIFLIDEKEATGLISKLLGVNRKAAVHFCQQVSQVLGWRKLINPKMVLEVLWRLEDRRELSPQVVASQIRQRSIAQDSIGQAAGQKSSPRKSSLGDSSTTGFEAEGRKVAQKFFGELHLHLPKATIIALNDFGRKCWIEIQKERSYQVPSRGYAEIMASDKLESLIGLKRIRFVQEGIRAPGVFLYLEFGEQHKVGIVKINSNGCTEGFHKFVGPDNSFEAIIGAVALSYYRDLVTPGEVYLYRPGSGTAITGSAKSENFRSLPRPRSIPIADSDKTHIQHRQGNSLNEWYEAQESVKRRVIGHVRWVKEHFVATSVKQRQALEAGIKLAAGYTWVVEHERCKPESGEVMLDSKGHLVKKTLFLPPERASIELDRILRT